MRFVWVVAFASFSAVAAAMACGSSDDGGGATGDDAGSSGASSGASGSGSSGASSSSGGGDDAANDSGPPAVLPAGPSSIGAGYDYACALGASGALRCWGDGYGEPRAVAAGTTFSDVAGSTYIPSYATGPNVPSTCAVRSDGALLCWAAWAEAPAVLDPGPYTKVALTQTGGPCAVAKAGTLRCWTGQPLVGAQIGTDSDWAYVVGGATETCAIKTSGDLYCFGLTGFSGVPEAGTTTSPQHVMPGTKFKDVAGGPASVCAVAQDGSLLCWGQIAPSLDGAPKAIGADKDWARVAVAYQSACMLKTNGTLHCFGSNGFGQLGAATPLSAPMPTQLGTETDWTSLTAGEYFYCGTKKDGSARCWGSDGLGQLGRGTDHTTPTKIAGSYANVSAGTETMCAATTGGAITCWGARSTIFPVGANAPVVASPTTLAATGWSAAISGLSSVHHDACAIASADATLACWGFDEYGQVGTGAASGSNVASPTSVGIPAKAVTLGFDHTCAIHTDGSLYCWGQKSSGGAPAGDALTPQKVGTDTWVAVSGGLDDTCGIKTDGTTWCWGGGYSSPMQQLGVTYTALASSIGGLARYGLNGSGAVVGIAYAPVTFSGTYKALGTGGAHVCAVKTDGTLWCGGDPYSGQLGNGDVVTLHAAAVQVGTATDWADVAGASESTCGRRTNGDVYCWGENTYGQIGDGTATSITPVVVH